MCESIVKIVVTGALGRMGQMILDSCVKKSGIKVIGAVEAQSHPGIGGKTGIKGLDITVTDDIESVLEENVILIDFTTPEATMSNLRKVVRKKAKMVIGTTGLSSEQKDIVLNSTGNIPVVMSPNMSVGVNLLFKLTEQVAAALGEDFDIEIVEAHHNLKKDAPSGTALGLAEAAARGRKTELEKVASYGRKGIIGERPKGEIGVHAVRGGDIVGDHVVLFAGDGERIELKHMAHSRVTFANGSVKAALFLKDQTKGLFTMSHVLGLD